MVPVDFDSSAGECMHVYVDCNRYDIDDIDNKRKPFSQFDCAPLMK